MLTASDLFAISQGDHNEGSDSCHWCGSACKPVWLHDDARPMVGVRPTSSARRPGSMYICMGCHLWRRLRVTVPFLSGGFKDGLCPEKQSWLVTPESAHAVRMDDCKMLWTRLLDPPRTFFLSLAPGGVNRLHLCSLNDVSRLEATTSLTFTLDNILHTYSVMELEIALRQGDEGRDPGVRALIRFLGQYGPLPKVPSLVTAQTNKGHPPRGESTVEKTNKASRRVLSVSGQVPH